MAKDFYGTAYTPSRAADLDAAHKWLLKAIDFEIDGNAAMAQRAFDQALKKEAAAFATGV